MSTGLAVGLLAMPPLVTDDADIVPSGDWEITVGYEHRAKGGGDRQLAGFDVVTGVAAHAEAGFSLSTVQGKAWTAALGTKAVTQPGADTGWSFGAALEHAWVWSGRDAGESAREWTLYGAGTRYTTWGGLDTNVGLIAPARRGLGTGSARWIAGQSLRWSPGSRWDGMLELYGIGRPEAGRWETTALRAAVRRNTRGEGSWATGVDITLPGASRVGVFVSLTELLTRL